MPSWSPSLAVVFSITNTPHSRGGLRGGAARAQAALRLGFQGLPCVRGMARLPDRDHALTRVLIWRGQASSAQQPIPKGTSVS